MFKSLQPREPRSPAKKMIQDVRTRWNSTYLMLARAMKLHNVINEWLEQDNIGLTSEIRSLAIVDEEWEQIQYLMVLLKPYLSWTECLSRTKGITIHMAWTCFNDLYHHIDKVNTKLSSRRRNMRLWKRELCEAIQAARNKLATYYSRTEGEGGVIYNLACVLDPAQKLELYKGEE